MKTAFISALLAMAVAPGVYAAKVVKNYQEAQASLTDDGYVLVAYPDGWNKKGQEAAQKLIASSKVLDAAGNAVLIPIGRKQISDQAAKDGYKAVLDKLPYPDAPSYPAFILLDKAGKHYATVCGSFMRQCNDEKAAAELRKLLGAKKEQDKLMEDAAKAKDGLTKARMLGRAAEIPGITRPNDIQKMIKAADPEDKSGYTRRLAYHPWAFAETIAKNNDKKPVEQIVKEIEDMLEDKAYSNEQKQKMCTTLIGVMRRSGDPEQMKRIPLIAERMRSYAPDTPEAKSAPTAVRQWVRELSLGDGWSPAVLPRDNKPVELAGPIPIKEPGTYQVTFQYTSGTQALVIEAVELYDGRTRITEDRHKGSTGHKSSNNVYTLKPSMTIRNPRVVVTFNMKDYDSHGTITIIKK